MGEHRTGSVRLPTPWTKSLSVSHDVEVTSNNNTINTSTSAANQWL